MRIGNLTPSSAALNRPNIIAGGRDTSSEAFGSTSTTTEKSQEPPKASSSQPTREALLKKLNDYIEKGPVVAMREKILESMGLTEDELKALPPEKQNAIEAEIAEKIKEMLLRQQDAAKNQQANNAKVSLYTALSGL